VCHQNLARDNEVLVRKNGAAKNIWAALYDRTKITWMWTAGCPFLADKPTIALGLGTMAK
jgi:hypothetical protein